VSRAARGPGAAAAVLAAAALIACGSDAGGSGSTTAGARPTLVVSAAKSLKAAFTAYAAAFPDAQVRFQFAGSDELAAQIEQGVRPDVYAAANTKLPDRLHTKGLVARPVVFAGNRLVLAVPADAKKVGSLADLARPGTTVAVGAAGVPIGDYTRKVLGRLPAEERAAILRNVRTEEPDVGGIVGKLTQGAVDAGFVYVTDVVAADGALRAIPLPAALQPTVAYGAAVVDGTEHAQAARAFIAGLLRGPGQQALRQAGFLPPPGS
jgi:molybdate transport system substrate-binding protein